jgi:hypothetical protein
MPGGDIMNDLIKAIHKFGELLEKHPDSPHSVPVFSQFIKAFLRTNTKSEVLPTIEIMTVLKHKKPLVFTLIKKGSSQKNIVMDMITHIEVDLDEALHRLESLKSKGKIQNN